MRYLALEPAWKVKWRKTKPRVRIFRTVPKIHARCFPPVQPAPAFVRKGKYYCFPVRAVVCIADTVSEPKATKGNSWLNWSSLGLLRDVYRVHHIFTYDGHLLPRPPSSRLRQILPVCRKTISLWKRFKKSNVLSTGKLTVYLNLRFNGRPVQSRTPQISQ